MFIDSDDERVANEGGCVISPGDKRIRLVKVDSSPCGPLQLDSARPLDRVEINNGAFSNQMASGACEPCHTPTAISYGPGPAILSNPVASSVDETAGPPLLTPMQNGMQTPASRISEGMRRSRGLESSSSSSCASVSSKDMRGSHPRTNVEQKGYAQIAYEHHELVEQHLLGKPCLRAIRGPCPCSLSARGSAAGWDAARAFAEKKSRGPGKLYRTHATLP